MLLCYALLLLPAAIAWYFRIPILRRLGVAVLRMTVQLSLVGLALVYLFRWENWWLNLAWVVGMIVFATFSAINNSELDYRRFFLPVLGRLACLACLFCSFSTGCSLISTMYLARSTSSSSGVCCWATR